MNELTRRKRDASFDQGAWHGYIEQDTLSHQAVHCQRDLAMLIFARTISVIHLAILLGSLVALNDGKHVELFRSLTLFQHISATPGCHYTDGVPRSFCVPPRSPRLGMVERSSLVRNYLIV
jgi:hypothetical protein